MRLTIAFFFVLVGIVLAWRAFTLISSTAGPGSFGYRSTNYEDINKIMTSTDMEFLRQRALHIRSNEVGLKIHKDVTTATTLIGIAMLLEIVTFILLFLEIAARGRSYRA